MYLNPEEGYSKAKKLLEARFGQKHNIEMAYVDQLTNGPYIKAEDAESLEGFSILQSSCTNTLKAIGYLNKIEGPDNMRKIIEMVSSMRTREKFVSKTLRHLLRRSHVP